MARFDVRANLHKGSRDAVPYLLDIQADLLAGLGTRLVVPLVPATAFGPPAARLNPVFRIAGRNHVMDTAAMAAIPVRQLGGRIASLSDKSAEVLAAVDFLISGI